MMTGNLAITLHFKNATLHICLQDFVRKVTKLLRSYVKGGKGLKILHKYDLQKRANVPPPTPRTKP